MLGLVILFLKIIKSIKELHFTNHINAKFVVLNTFTEEASLEFALGIGIVKRFTLCVGRKSR